MRHLLQHAGQQIALPDGETLIGRGLRCRIRFNDPTISREHLRIVVHGGRATVVNLSSTGTLLNGKRLGNPRQLSHDDVLRLGYRTLKVVVMDGELESLPPQRRAAFEDLLLAESVDEENTRPGDDGWRKRAYQTMASNEHVCPSCRTRDAFGGAVCAACGYVWPPGSPSRVTQPIPVEDLRPREEARFRVEVPIIYSSATLTANAVARDISRGGMFIAIHVSDPVGTPCELTALPDGHPAMTFSGVVAHVADQRSALRTHGLGIRIVTGSEEALRWLEKTLARFAEAIVED